MNNIFRSFQITILRFKDIVVEDDSFERESSYCICDHCEKGKRGSEAII